ncbi:MAG: serine hydrolase, partial [Caulobacteraceae bacterium]
MSRLSPLFLAFAALVMTGAAAPPAGPLPKPDINGSYLFWKPEEQLVGYRNMEKVFPTHVIRRGAKVHPLPQGKPLTVRYPYEGETWDADRFMDATNAAGVLVIHHDKIVLERYHLGYGPDQRWTSFSVGKSISSTLAGAALKDGYIKSLEDPVTTYLPGLRGSAYE